jgi:peptide/nickel transport system ATP-binding protein/oligopeptide transport system ATP-binding protein
MNVTFTIKEGETLGKVGESGCGKTTIGRTILRPTEPTSGAGICREGCFQPECPEMKELRRNMQIIFQDPYASLDPRVPIGDSVMEGLKIHNLGSAKEQYDATITILKRVGLEEYHARRFPHDFPADNASASVSRALWL